MGYMLYVLDFGSGSDPIRDFRSGSALLKLSNFVD
jgi:hypothetical protein